MNGLAVVEVLWRHTGVTKHAMEASYEENSCIPNMRTTSFSYAWLTLACNVKWLHEHLAGLH